MSRGSNPALRVGDVLLNTTTRVTTRVLRVIGRRVEVEDIHLGESSRTIVDSLVYETGIASGRVRRLASTQTDS